MTAREPKLPVPITAGPCGGIKNMPPPTTALGKLLARILDSSAADRQADREAGG